MTDTIGCSQYEVTQCMTPITKFRHQLGIPDDIHYFPVYKLDAHQMDTYCQ